MKHHVSQNIKLIKSGSSQIETNEVNLVDEHSLELVVNNNVVNTFTCINENLDEIVVG